MRYYARLKKRDGSDYMFEIKKEWIDNIVLAVEAQILVSAGGITIDGTQYASVDIIETEG